MNTRCFQLPNTANDIEAQTLAALVRERWTEPFHIALIAGSGIHEALKNAECRGVVSYADLPGLPRSGVVGHSNELRWLRITGKNVLMFGGRFHRYEGHSLSTSMLAVRISAALGIPSLICSNAAGGMNTDFAAADIMLADDLQNWTQACVCVGSALPKKSQLLDREWTNSVAKALTGEAWIHRGVYCSVNGPSYETRAEIRMFSRFADAIGMSTVHEAQAATQLGLSVVAFSVITNVLMSGNQSVLHHSEVVSAARLASAHIARIIDVCCST